MRGLPQPTEDLLMHHPVGSHDITSLQEPSAILHIGTSPPRFVHDKRTGGQIPHFQSELPKSLRPSRGDVTQVKSGGAVPPHPSRGLEQLPETGDILFQIFRFPERKARDNQSLTHIPYLGDLDFLPPQKSSPALNCGEELVPFPNTAPSEQYDRFITSFTSYLCASMGMPVELLLMKFNANYSASRACLILFWRVAQIYRNEVRYDTLGPVYEAWLCGEIASGRTKAPGWCDPRLRAAWLASNWIGSQMPNIDPQRTATADKMYVEMGSQTLDRVARNFNGSTGSAMMEEEDIVKWDFAKKRAADAAIHRAMAQQKSGGGGAADPAAIGHHGHTMQLRNVLDAIAAKSKPLIDGAEGRIAVEIILAVYKAAETGRSVALPLRSDPVLKARKAGWGAAGGGGAEP